MDIPEPVAYEIHYLEYMKCNAVKDLVEAGSQIEYLIEMDATENKELAVEYLKHIYKSITLVFNDSSTQTVKTEEEK